jgi:hypothetical protein
MARRSKGVLSQQPPRRQKADVATVDVNSIERIASLVLLQL